LARQLSHFTSSSRMPCFFPNWAFTNHRGRPCPPIDHAADTVEPPDSRFPGGLDSSASSIEVEARRDRRYRRRSRARRGKRFETKTAVRIGRSDVLPQPNNRRPRGGIRGRTSRVESRTGSSRASGSSGQARASAQTNVLCTVPPLGAQAACEPRETFAGRRSHRTAARRRSGTARAITPSSPAAAGTAANEVPRTARDRTELADLDACPTTAPGRMKTRLRRRSPCRGERARPRSRRKSGPPSSRLGRRGGPERCAEN